MNHNTNENKYYLVYTHGATEKTEVNEYTNEIIDYSVKNLEYAIDIF